MLKQVQYDKTSFYDIYSKTAFTLAEVLITLLIIGVISAITVPVLINKTNKEENITKLKKAYSTMAQATKQIIASEGPVYIWTTNENNIATLYRKRVNNIKNCSSNTGCFSQKVYKINKKLWGTWDTISGWQRYVLPDGVQIMHFGARSDCDIDESINNTGSVDVCSYILVDVNGEKKPNIIGRDIFLFVLKRDGLHPSGCDVENSCNNSATGYACTCKVLREGAINY